MYVREFHGTNFKAIQDVTIRPGEAGIFIIGGDNEQGKTSLIDAIAYCLQGKGAGINRPLRNGEDEAELTAELDGPEGLLSITRRLKRTADGSVSETLTVKNAQGFKVHSPAKLLEGLVSALAFDFSALANGRGKAADKERRELVLRAFGLGEELDACARERKAAYQRRRDVNRDLKRARERLAALPEVPAQLPERKDVSALVAARDAEVKAAAERRRGVDAVQARAREAAHLCKSWSDRKADDEAARTRCADDVRRVEEQLRLAKERLNESEARAAESRDHHQKALEAQTEAAEEARAAESSYTPADTDFLDLDIDAAREANAQADQLEQLSKQRAALEAEAAQLATASNRETAVMSDLDARQRAAVEQVAAELPGTEIEPDVVDPETGEVTRAGELLLTGVPFSEAAKSRRFRWAFQVCARANPTLKLVACRDGEAFGDSALEELRTVAVEQGYQFLVERVGEDDDGALIIEAGRVKGEVA